MILKEEWIVTMLQIILKIVPRMYFGQNSFQYLFVICKELIESVGFKLLMSFEINVFAERKP